MRNRPFSSNQYTGSYECAIDCFILVGDITLSKDKQRITCLTLKGEGRRMLKILS